MGNSGRSQEGAGPHNPGVWNGEVTEEGGRWLGAFEKPRGPAIRKRVERDSGQNPAHGNHHRPGSSENDTKVNHAKVNI